MILKSRHMALRVIPVAVVLLAASAGFATHAAAAGPYYVSPFGSDTNTCQSAADPCATVQAAVTKSSSGDTINLAAGAYVEQVTIDHNVTIAGAGQDESTIEAPASLTNNLQTPPQTFVVDISGSGTTVSMSKLTVAGPGGQSVGGCNNDPSSLDKGITIHGGATLHLSSAAVRNVYNMANQGCQRGDAISIGSACFSCAVDTGQATLTNVKVKVYQKNGIAVRGSGSTLSMTGGSVANNPTTHIASNGIEVVTGAVAVVSGAAISGNECNVPVTCGPNPYSDTQSAGVLIIGAGAGTQFTGDHAFGNDEGFYTDSGVPLTHDNASGNRYVGIFVSAYDGLSGPAANAVVKYDTASSVSGVGQYGIITTSGSFNRFSFDTATGNSLEDMDASQISGTDSNHYASNHCTTALPSPAHWACT